MGDLLTNDLTVSTNLINEQSDSNFNQSINGTTTTTIKNLFKLSPETLRMFYIAIAIIIVLICLTVLIYICLRRRCKSKHQDNKDKLLPEQSKKPSKTPTINSLTNNRATGSSNPPTSSNSKTPINSFYYDNLDDIPFIDESRPTSVVDMTQV